MPQRCCGLQNRKRADRGASSPNIRSPAECPGWQKAQLLLSLPHTATEYFKTLLLSQLHCDQCQACVTAC